MTKWENKELEKIEATDELKISPSNKEGKYYKPVIIWVVRVVDELYVRSYKGTKGSWYQHAQANHKGRISAGGITKEVNFVGLTKEENTLNDKIDQAYRTKYQKYSKTYVEPMITAQARATTIRLDPI